MRRIFKGLGRGLLFPAVLIPIALMLSAGRTPSAAQAASLRTPQAHIAAKARRRRRHHPAHHANRTAGKRHAPQGDRGAERAHIAAAMPVQGIFGNCDIQDELSVCEQDLQAMQAAGLRVDVQTARYSVDSMSAFAGYAQSIGMSIMWEINDPGFWGGEWAGSSAANDFPQFASLCGCTATGPVLNAMIGWLAAQPATYGYYAADDELLTPSERQGLTQYVAAIRAIDPSHMVMVGASASQAGEFQSTGATLGHEIYPITTNSLMPFARYAGIWQSVQESIAQDQRSATQAGAQSAFILQAFTFGDNLEDGQAVGVCTASMTEAQCASRLTYPSAAAQLELRNLVLQNAAPKLILWFKFSETYGQGDRWNELDQVIDAPAPVTAVAARARRVRRARVRRARRAREARRARATRHARRMRTARMRHHSSRTAAAAR